MLLENDRWLMAPRIEFANRNLVLELKEKLIPEYSPVLTLHTVYGKENDQAKSDFTNVVNNQALKGLVGTVLTNRLGWDTARQHRFVNAALAPNANLYMKRKPQEFSESEKISFDKYRASLFLDEKLVTAAGPDFFNSGRWQASDVTEDEQLMVLVSDLVEEREPHKLALVNPESHILDWMVSARAEQGKEYWMNELKQNYRTMAKLFPDIKIEDYPLTVYRMIQELK